MNLMNITAKIFLDTSNFIKGLTSSGKAANSFVSKVSTGFKNASKVVLSLASAVSAVSGAVAGAALKMIDYGDEIDKNSQKLGLSTKAYQEWSLAAQMAGTDTSTLQTGIRSLTDWIGKLTKGDAEAIIATRELGIEEKEFSEMGFDDQLKTIVEALQGMEDQTKKTELAQQLFGNRTYQELMPLLNQEKGSLDELFETMEEGGMIIEDAGIKKSAELSDKLEVLKSTVKTTAIQMSVDLFPALTNVVDGLQGLVTGSDGAADALANGLGSIMDGVVKKVPDLVETVGNLALQLIEGMTKGNTLGKLVSGLFSALKTIINGVIKIFPQMSGTILDLVQEFINGIGSLLPTITSPSFLNPLIKTMVGIVTTLLGSLKNIDWSSIVSNLLDVIFDTIELLLDSPEIITDIIELFVNIFIEAGVQILQKLIQTIGNTEFWKKLLSFGKTIGIGLVNGLIDGLNKLSTITIPGASIGKWKLWDDTQLTVFSIPKIKNYAQGGMMDALGTLYRAGENGAEIVAQGARGTGVANVEQIAEAQYNAMEEYGLKEEIRHATNAIVSAMQRGGAQYSRRQLLDALVDGVNDGLVGQGRRSLKEITAY